MEILVKTKRLHNLDVLIVWFEGYLVTNGYRNQTVQSYNHELSIFRRWLDNETSVYDVDDISKEIILEYVSYLYKRGYASTTIAHKKAVLKSFLKSSYIENQIYRDLSQYIPESKLSRRIPRTILTEQDMTLLFEYLEVLTERPQRCYADAVNYRDRTMIELLYSCGLRKGELLPLRVTAIDLTNELLYVYNGKGGKDRVVPIGSYALEVLSYYLTLIREKLITATSEDFLFPSKRGGHVSMSAFAETVNRVCERAGIEKNVRVHDFRHACATHMLNRGADIRYVQELLGHSSLSSTQIYTHVAVEHLKKSHEKYHPRSAWTL